MSSLFDKILIKEQMKRYWALGVLHFLTYFLLILMPMWNSSNPAYTAVEILSLRDPIVLILNIIIPLAAASNMFSHMYKPNAAITVYTMPFSRKKIFYSNAFAGLLLIVIPLLLFSLLLLVFRIENDFLWYSTGMSLKEIPSGSTINTVSNVTMFFLKTLLSFVFYYVLFIAAAMIVGHQIMHLIVSVLLAFIAVIVKLGFDVGASYYIFGYYADMSLLSQILLYTNPLLLGSITGNISTGVKASYYIVYAVIMISLVMLSAWLHHKRRLERTADMVVFAPIRHFLVFITSTAGMIFMGGFLHMLLGGGMVIIYAGFIVGFILAFYIAQMVIEKSFNVLYRMKWIVVHGLMILAVMSSFNAINIFNIGGYVRYVPKPDDVAGVYLGYANNLTRYGSNPSVLEAMFIKEPLVIERTIQAHEMIIDNRRDLRKVFVNNITGQEHSSNRQIQSITYMLKNGAKVTRKYVLSQDIFEQSGMRELISSTTSLISDIFWVKKPQVVNRIDFTMYEVEKKETDDETKADYYVYNCATLPVNVYDTNHIKALTEAVTEDYLRNVELFKHSDRDKLDYLHLEVSLSDNGINETVNLYFYENTLKCLLENDYSFKSTETGVELHISQMRDQLTSK